MTNVTIMSDLHLECGKLDDLPGGDILILAGDTIEVSHLRWRLLNKTRWQFKRFVKHELSKYKIVLYVLGNHEYYNMYMDEVKPMLVSFFRECDVDNIHILDDATVTLEGVKFIGSTLWSKFGFKTDNQDIVQDYVQDMTDIKKKGHKLSVEDIFLQHMQSVSFIKKELSNTTLPTVVITHFVPMLQAFDHFIPLEEIWVSDQTALINMYKPNVWIYGHNHISKDFVINQTRFISNQRGCLSYEPCAQYFNPGVEFDLKKLVERIEQCE
jgi:predicted phosphodiesterase